MTLEKFQIKDRRPVDIPEIEQFIANIDAQSESNPRFIAREISLYIVNIFLHREELEKSNKKKALLDVLDLEELGAVEQQLFDQRRRVVGQYLVKKMEDIKERRNDTYLQFFDKLKGDVDQLITARGFPQHIIDLETKRIFFMVTQELIELVKDEYYTLTHLSSLERQYVIDTLQQKYPDMSKSYIHRIRRTMNNDAEMVAYVDNELMWLSQLFLENMPESKSFVEYLGRICELWDDMIDAKNLYAQYQESLIDTYSFEIEKSLRRKENDRKGPIKKTNEHSVEKASTGPVQSIQRYSPELQSFINHFFPEQFLLHKDLQRIYRNNKFFYRDDLASRLNISGLSPEMEEYCNQNGIELRERQKDAIVTISSEPDKVSSPKPLIISSNTIESRLADITAISLENRVIKYIELFKELGYSFLKEEEFMQRTLEMCRSNVAIEKSIRKVLKDISNGIEESKKIGRDFYTFQLYNGCRIVLPKKGEILNIGSHDRYETLLKNNF